MSQNIWHQNHSLSKDDKSFELNIHKIFADAKALLIKKHEAYGPTNISRAPGGPENGLRVRMHDKMARLNHILEHPNVDTNDESLEDTLNDLLNYCAIFIMVRRGQWPDTEVSRVPRVLPSDVKLISDGCDCG